MNLFKSNILSLLSGVKSNSNMKDQYQDSQNFLNSIKKSSLNSSVDYPNFGIFDDMMDTLWSKLSIATFYIISAFALLLHDNEN